MDNGASSYRRFLEGDKNGLSEIVRMYADGLILYINSFVHDVHTAEDLTEDVFAKLIAKKPAYSGRSSFKTWLYTIARNIALDHVKHKKLKNESSIDDMYDIADKTDIEKRYIKSEDMALLYRLIEKLAPDYRLVLLMVYIEGFDNDEASHLMNKSKRQTENLLYRAKQALKKEYEKEGISYEEL